MAPSHYSQERKGFWHEPEGTPTSESLALETWARLARDILIRTAGTYHAVVRESELAEELQESSSIRTTRHHDRWLPKVLAPIAVFCERVDEPPLTSLVVGTSDDLDAARQRLECYQWAGSAPTSLVVGTSDDLDAARQRLECYQWAGSAPADGGVPAQLPGTASPARRARSASPRTRTAAAPAAPKRVAKTDRPVSVCPTCFMALPATGVCDNCD